MNLALTLSGVLALLAAGVHGVAGELLVVRKLQRDHLPGSAFGGPEMTKAMIRATWHIATAGFLTAGAALILAGSVLDGEVAEGLALLGAAASTAFVVVVLGAGGSVPKRVRLLFRHPAPALLTIQVVLAWVGAL